MADADRASGMAVDHLTPAEAFELLGHETRIGIVETLGEADEPVAFSTLRRRVGVRDPGQFNYHLDRLDGHFVRETDEGYTLTVAGLRVVGAVLAGRFTATLQVDEIELDATCIGCGTNMITRVREAGVAITCETCGVDFTDQRIPPGAFEGCAPSDVPRVVDRWLKRVWWTGETGFCHACEGPIERRVRLHTPMDPIEGPDGTVLEALAVDECPRCGESWTSLVATTVLTAPAVVAFHHAHGIDLRSTPVWDLPWLEPGLTSVTGRAPLRLEVPIALGDETLVVTLDEDLSVIDARRTRSSTG